ncbi:MAG TPA: FecR domain-containing protein, partial [Polyangia bacterium]
REQTVAALAHAMIGKRRQRRARVLGIFAAAAALVLVAGLAALDRLHSTSSPDRVAMLTGEGFGKGMTVMGEAGPRTLMARAALQPGERLVASDAGWGTVDLKTGSRLVLERGSEVLIERADRSQRFALARGSLRAEVAKLKTDERFVVTTADAEVEVRGTSFRVWVAPAQPGCASQTRVAVYEGVVQVRHGSEAVLLTRGSHWPQGCEPGANPVAPTEPAKISVKAPVVHRPAHPRPVASVPTDLVAEAPAVEPMPKVVPSVPSVPSTLAVQNQLFAEATAAARSGHTRTALSMYERLESLYPDGPLAESSMVARLRLLRGQDGEAARAVARRYLSRFPTGFARSEAQGLSPR